MIHGNIVPNIFVMRCICCLGYSLRKALDIRVSGKHSTSTTDRPGQFQAIYEEDVKIDKVRFVTPDVREEHGVRLFLTWENQRVAFCAAFCCEMMPDDSQPEQHGLIFVKSVDRSPPDPTDTIGSDPTEHHVRIHVATIPASRSHTWPDDV
jgi:hypothetical protein